MGGCIYSVLLSVAVQGLMYVRRTRVITDKMELYIHFGGGLCFFLSILELPVISGERNRDKSYPLQVCVPL